MEKLDFSTFSQIPILHDGRIKPLDSVARVMQHRLHADIGDQPPIAWLAESLLRPDEAITQLFMHVAEPALRAALALPESDGARYSFTDIATAFEAKRELAATLLMKESDQLSPYEVAFLNLYSAVHDYAQITQALMPVLPVGQPDTADYLNAQGLDAQTASHRNLLTIKESIMADLGSAVEAHGENMDAYSDQQKQAAMLAFALAKLEISGTQNQFFRVMPSHGGDAQEWVAPWVVYRQGHAAPQASALLDRWEVLARAYHNGDNATWHASAENIVQQTTAARDTADWQLWLEVLYTTLPLTIWAMVGYGLACVLSLVCYATQHRLAGRMATWAVWSSVAVHASLLMMRVALLERPPVSTLYESILFVSLIAALLGLWMDRKGQGQHEGRLIGSLLGAALLGVSGIYAEQGDTLGVLIAVLNTNFWLATHVVCITIGYGCAIVAGTLAHLYLLKRTEAIGKQLQSIALIALLFTAIGTILGGIWADQSWGRFWGWDPKENGALLIVLWLVWALHGRLTGHLRAIGFATVLALTNIVVALSWFGVNLLSVGLHSYGFTDNAALGLGLFCLSECMLIGGLWWHARGRRRVAAHAG